MKENNKQIKFKLTIIKILIFLVAIVGIIFLFNAKCYAGYSFSETTKNIDNIGTEMFSSFNNFLTQLLGFNFMYVPYIAIILYILIQIILMKKYKSDKSSKGLKVCLKINVIVILCICLINTLISNFVIDRSKEVVYITSSMFIQNSFVWAEIINIVINTLILILGVIFSRKLLKNGIEKNEKLQNKKMLIIVIVLIVILSTIHIFIKRGPQMHVVERDWSFGETIDNRKYDIKVYEGEYIGNTVFFVKEIDSEGVLIEYERGYYERQPSSNDSNPFEIYNFNYTYKTEIVQQKMKWNVNYSYNPAKNPMLAVDGGTDYYVRFEK